MLHVVMHEMNLPYMYLCVMLSSLMMVVATTETCQNVG